MKLTVLGPYAPYAPVNAACNGYLLEEDEVSIMLDCGNGAFAKLQKHLDFRRLKALVITHYHPDHFHDYHCIRHAIGGSLRDGSRQDPLLVYAPGQVEAPWQEMAAWREEFVLIPLEDYQEAPASLGNLFFYFLPTRHPVPCFAVKFSDGLHKIVYTSDTGWSGELAEFAAGADLLLCESSLRNMDLQLSVAKGHLTAGQAGSLATQAKVKQLMLTHLWPEFDQMILLREAENCFAGKVELAREGLVYIIG